jgi:hypothetical protein
LTIVARSASHFIADLFVIVVGLCKEALLAFLSRMLLWEVVVVLVTFNNTLSLLAVQRRLI